jgi:hypothetical protein
MRSSHYGQDHVYSFRNARNSEDAAQRSQGSYIGSFDETLHGRFPVLALNVHGFCHRIHSVALKLFLNFTLFFSKNINISIRHYWLNWHLLRGSITG